MPLRYKVLFLGQSVIFTMAIIIRGRDIDKAQRQLQTNLEDEEE